MNRPTSNNHEDDDETRGWISEAGDPCVEPRPEHVEQLRGLLLDRLGPPRRNATTPPWLNAARWLVAACVLVAAGLGIFNVLARPVNAWARVAQAMQEKTWIHVVSQVSKDFSSESWISPRFQIEAYKYDHGPEESGTEYHDLKMGIKTQYVPGENTIYRLPEGPAFRKHLAVELMAFDQLLRGEIFKISPIPDTEIVGQTSREVVDQGKTWKEYELTVRGLGTPETLRRMWLQVDPRTGLPRTWDVEVGGGAKIRQVLDYPDFGPADILAMGVPAAAKRVDRIPSDDLNRLLTALKVGRNRFDDYCGYSWSEGTTPPNVKRVWRKGRKWRVDCDLPRVTTKAALFEYDKVPNDADLAWWQRRDKDVIYEPQAICDGQTIWYYNYKPQPLRPDKPYSSKLESVTSQPVYGSLDDPRMPWPHLLPEQLGHRSVDVPDNEREFLLEPKPDDGPPNTVRLRVRIAKSNDPNRPDFYRLWVDPEKNYLALRSEMSVYERGNLQSKIAYVDTQVLTDFARSPSGFWYPTRVVRTTSNSKHEQVTRFTLDFEAQIPDRLFEPPK
ncbi:MAG: hypothetical protein ACHRXM_12220 [Isosphaerales bacterium]